MSTPISPKKDGSVFYAKTWGDFRASTTTQADREERNENATAVGQEFYDWATDIYIQCWSPSFHFSRLQPGEPYMDGIKRAENFLAMMLELKPGMRVLELGSGIGGPAREMARFAGVHVTGVNLHKYQLHLAREITKQKGLQDKVEFVEGDFMNLPFATGTFDAVYAIEATCYAPTMKGVYSEAIRVLKPGGRFGTYEFCMSALYDDTNAAQREIRNNIEFGTGIPILSTPQSCLEAFEAVGFEDIWSRDMCIVDELNTVPWWFPIDGNMSTAKTRQEKINVFFMKEKVAKPFFKIFKTLGKLGLIEKEKVLAMEMMHLAVFTMRDAGRLGLFTSDFLLVGRKSRVQAVVEETVGKVE